MASLAYSGVEFGQQLLVVRLGVNETLPCTGCHRLPGTGRCASATTPSARELVLPPHRRAPNQYHRHRMIVNEDMPWYLRSMKDQDTHRAGELRDDGLVDAECGIQFRPRSLPLGKVALPGEPPDPGQTCPTCRRRSSAR